jgi:hypothetical protein
MYAFHSAGHRLQPHRIGIETGAGGEAQQGPNALATIEHGIAHGAMQASGKHLRWRQCLFQGALDTRLYC